MNNKNKISFEKALKDLEEIVENLNNDDLDLEKAIAAYEKGMELKKICEQRLKEANWKIDSCKYQMDRLSDQEVEAEDRLELIREDREIALVELKEAIQKRNKLTKTVKEV